MSKNEHSEVSKAREKEKNQGRERREKEKREREKRDNPDKNRILARSWKITVIENRSLARRLVFLHSFLHRYLCLFFLFLLSQYLCLLLRYSFFGGYKHICATFLTVSCVSLSSRHLSACLSPSLGFASAQWQERLQSPCQRPHRIFLGAARVPCLFLVTRCGPY